MATETNIVQVIGRSRLAWLVFVVPLLVGVALLLWYGPVAQDENYHNFADQRTLIGIPNFWNVVSNLPFAIVGLAGLAKRRGLALRLLFLGVFLTAFGSGYYHWEPTTPRLVWDRLPMTIVFMSLFAIVIAERFPKAPPLLWPFLAAGIASVVWWRVSGDLRPYVLVQFVPMLMIPLLILLWPVRAGLWPVIGFYVLAKIAELADKPIYSFFPLSGHTLKHLFAALATYFILRWARD